MDPDGARKSKIALGEPTRTAMSVRVADIRHVPAPSGENEPNVREKYARSPNAILVSFEWEKQLLNTAEGTNTSDGHAEGTQPLSEARWESGSASILSEDAPGATTASSRKSAEATEDGCRPDATELAPHWWRKTCTKEPYDQWGSIVLSGLTRIDRVVTGVTMWRGHARFSGDFLVGTVSYDLVLGLDWLTEHKVASHFQSDRLRTYVNGQWCELPFVRTGEENLQGEYPTVVHPRTPTEQAYEILAKQVAGMLAEETAIFLRPPPKRYKSHAKTKAKARITSLVHQAAADTKSRRAPLQGLHLILALPGAGSAVPVRFSDEWQGAFCCVLIGNQPTSSGWGSPFASTALTAAEGEEGSPWPMAKLEHTLFDEWINSTEAQDVPCEIIQVLQEYRASFPDYLPKGLPPKRRHDRHILLVPGKLPAESAIYRMTPDQLTFHKQEIGKLLNNGWIGKPIFLYALLRSWQTKRDDGSGERKKRMVVNYQALNSLTIAPDFPLPPIQTILEMLGGAKYFSILDLEAGFHQIHMAKEDRWKKAFRSVLGLFEYRVMPFGLKVLEQDGKPIGFLSQFMNPTQQRYSIYNEELLALVTALDKWSHLLRVSKVTAYTDHKALTHLQRLQTSKPLCGCTGWWLDFLAEFPDLHITYAEGSRSQVADALSRRPDLSNTCSHDTPPTPLMLAVAQARVAPRTRGRPANYRKLAGIRSRRPRRRSLPSAASPSPPEPNPEVEHPTPTTKTPADISDALQWPQAHSKCPVIRAPYKVAADQPGEALQIEFRNRQFTFRYVQHYLHIRVHGLWRICISHFPEFLSRALHSHHDHVTAGYRGQKKTFAALSKHYYWQGMRAYTTAYIESCIHCRASKSLNQKPADLLQQPLIPSRRWAQSDIWQQLCSRFNIKWCMCSSYDPQSDGQTELVNRTLDQMLRTYIQSDERKLERLLPALELAYNTTSHSSTEFSTFEVMIGKNPLTAANLDIQIPGNEGCTGDPSAPRTNPSSHEQTEKGHYQAHAVPATPLAEVGCGAHLYHTQA
ncbi:hypothetical protein ENH_00013030 [Eimeria necatrix]|uniref:Integrase catalytic domain-containing protein n=1 Tax=Eimeria necatrix TaxID=51315 RepID=U6MVL7_9EIME|nr:hypothetical protein ENH_00013030 [Eimeria necatrix]CDJ65775.1 hypothetical protein ENH_00013030 [Eimeria necatrix]